MTHHWVRVDLTHVVASVCGSDVCDAQVPVFVVVTSEGETRVLADDRVVDRQDRLRLNEYPRHLERTAKCRTITYYALRKEIGSG